MRNVFSFGLLTFAILTTFQADAEDTRGSFEAPELKNIFGKDDRVRMYGSIKPWSAIGKLVTQRGNCTATLVARNVAVSAAHCFYDEMGNGPFDGFFLPNFKDNKSNAFVQIVELRTGTTRPHFEENNDWAVIRLSENIGDTYGFIPMTNLGTENVYKRTWGSITLAGYSGDIEDSRTAGVHEGCTIHGYQDGLYLHDCDSTSGSSGAAMILWTKSSGHRIVGVHVAARNEYRDGQWVAPAKGSAYRDEIANLAVPAAAFANAVNELKSKGTSR